MTTEKQYNKGLGECQYTELHRESGNVMWERVCGNNNIDYVVGINWKTKNPPTYVNFDISRSKDIALRFVNKEESSSFLFRRIGSL